VKPSSYGNVVIPPRTVSVKPYAEPRWSVDTEYGKGPSIHYLQVAHGSTARTYEHEHAPSVKSCSYCTYVYERPDYHRASDSEIAATTFTTKNSDAHTRSVLVEWYQKNGYVGPLTGGEARALKNLMHALGKTDCVVHGWIKAPIKYKSTRNKWVPKQGWTLTTTLRESEALRRVYLFKSPIDGIEMKDFVSLARMYQDDKSKLKGAILELLSKPTDELVKEVKTFAVIGKLAAL
jgi:hypothetical protein